MVPTNRDIGVVVVSWESPQLVYYERVHSPLETFFVSRIQKEEGVEEVRAHMSGHNIMARDIVAQSTELVSLYIGYWTLNNYYYYY